MATSRSLPKTLQVAVKGRYAQLSRVVTPVGWTLAVLGIVMLVAGHLLGWVELTTMAITALALVIGSIGFALGQADLDAELELRPIRVTAGQRALAQVTIRNPAGHRSGRLQIELRVGEGFGEFAVAPLHPGEVHEEPFLLPTVRRGVIPVGPVVSVRADPLGLLRRTQIWTDELELTVHPRLVPLLELGTGFVKDLEGQSTSNPTDSDISFYALRNYESGDDRRQIHWLSTARTGTLLVRQYVDTRRSHVGILVDGVQASYGSEEEFETALSVAGSLGVRVLADDQEVSCLVGDERVSSSTRAGLLDGLARIEGMTRRGSLNSAVSSMLRSTAGLTLAVVVTGSNDSFDELRRVAVRFARGARVLIIRIDPTRPSTFQPLGSQVLMSLESLEDLPHLLWSVTA